MVWVVCGPCVLTGVFVRGREEGPCQSVMTEAEVGVMRGRGQGCRQLLEAGKGKEMDPPQKEHSPAEPLKLAQRPTLNF